MACFVIVILLLHLIYPSSPILSGFSKGIGGLVKIFLFVLSIVLLVILVLLIFR